MSAIAQLRIDSEHRRADVVAQLDRSERAMQTALDKVLVRAAKAGTTSGAAANATAQSSQARGNSSGNSPGPWLAGAGVLIGGAVLAAAVVTAPNDAEVTVPAPANSSVTEDTAPSPSVTTPPTAPSTESDESAEAASGSTPTLRESATTTPQTSEPSELSTADLPVLLPASDGADPSSANDSPVITDESSGDTPDEITDDDSDGDDGTQTDEPDAGGNDSFNDETTGGTGDADTGSTSTAGSDIGDLEPDPEGDQSEGGGSSDTDTGGGDSGNGDTGTDTDTGGDDSNEEDDDDAAPPTSTCGSSAGLPDGATVVVDAGDFDGDGVDDQVGIYNGEVSVLVVVDRSSEGLSEVGALGEKPASAIGTNATIRAVRLDNAEFDIGIVLDDIDDDGSSTWVRPFALDGCLPVALDLPASIGEPDGETWNGAAYTFEGDDVGLQCSGPADATTLTYLDEDLLGAELEFNAAGPTLEIVGDNEGSNPGCWT